VTFEPQSDLGMYTITVGPGVTDTLGNAMAGPFTSRFAIIDEHVANGGFETGDFSNWLQSGNTGDTFVGEHAHNGRFAANLGPIGTTLGFLSQRIPTTPGTSYNLSYWLSNEAGTPNRFEAYIDGTLVPGSQLLNVGPQSYTNYTFTFVATGTLTEVKFGFREDPAYFYLDDVSVSPTPTPRPGGGRGAVAYPPPPGELSRSAVLPPPAPREGDPGRVPFPDSPLAPAAGGVALQTTGEAARAVAQLFAALPFAVDQDPLPRAALPTGADRDPLGLDAPSEDTWLL
jgi:hypothetical protein